MAPSTAAAGAARSGGDGGGTTPCSDLVEQANLDNKLQRLALTLECRRVGVGGGVRMRVRVGALSCSMETASMCAENMSSETPG